MTPARKGKWRPIGNKPVIVVLGRPGVSFVAGLRSVGMEPIAEDGNAVIWGVPAARTADGGSSRAREGAPPGPLMTIVDAAVALGLDRGATYELIGRGDLDVVQVGGSWRVPVHAVDDLKAHRALAGPQDGRAAQ